MNNNSDYLPNYHDHSAEVKEIPEEIELTASPFPYEDTPSVLSNWIRDMAEIKSMPPDYIAVGLIVSLATLIAGKVKIQPRKNDPRYLVIPNLWGMIIGRPSTMKSPALKLSLKYIEAFEDQLREENKVLLAKYDDVLRMHKNIEKIADGKILKTLKSRPSIDKEELIEKEGVGPKPEPPQQKRLLTNDTSIEMLAVLCSYNPEGILICRDELTGWLRSLDRHDRANDKAFYLEGWNGNVSYTTDRIGRGTQHIENLTLSVLGGTQPGVLDRYIREAVFNQGGDGLLQRFQLMVYPDVVQEEGNGNFPNEDYQRNINEMFDNFYSFSPNLFDYFLFDEKGQKHYEFFSTDNHKKTRSEQLSSTLEAHLGKYQSLYCSLAMIFTLVEDIDAEEINGHASYQAYIWTNYLESHARRIYGYVDDPYYSAKKIEEKLGDLIHWPLVPDEDQYITARKIYRKGWSGLKDISQVTRSLNQLEHLGWLKSVKAETGGRPETRFYPHPDLKNRYVEEVTYGFGDE